MPESVPNESKFYELARTKMTRVLGEQRAHRLMTQIMASLGIELRNVDELLQFASELSKLGGFEGAVGAMLSVQAIMHGAAAEPSTLRSHR